MCVVQYLSDANRWLRPTTHRSAQLCSVQFSSVCTPVLQPDSHHCAISFLLLPKCRSGNSNNTHAHTRSREKTKWKRRRSRRREWMNEWRKLYLIDLANLCTHSSKIRTRSRFPDFFLFSCCCCCSSALRCACYFSFLSNSTRHFVNVRTNSFVCFNEKYR